jgi:hypothetical protein
MCYAHAYEAHMCYAWRMSNNPTIVDRALNPDRRAFLLRSGAVMLAPASPLAQTPLGAASHAVGAVDPYHISMLVDAAHMYPTLLEGLRIPKGASPDEAYVLFRRVSDAANSLHYFNPEFIEDLDPSQITPELRAEMARLLKDRLVFWHEDISLDEALQRINGLLSRKEFGGIPLTEIGKVARSRMLEIMRVMEQPLAQLDLRQAMGRLFNDGIADAYEIPYQLLHKFGDELPAAFRTKLVEAYQHARWLEAQEGIQTQIERKLKKNPEYKPPRRDWFIEPSPTQDYQSQTTDYIVYCTVPDPRKQSEILEELRGQFETNYPLQRHAEEIDYDDHVDFDALENTPEAELLDEDEDDFAMESGGVEVSDSSYNPHTKRYEMLVHVHGDGQASEVFLDMAADSAMVLAAKERHQGRGA